MFGCKRVSGAGVALILVLAAALPSALAQIQKQSEEGGLSALMERNRDHFQNLVQTAYFESVTKPLAEIDYQRIRQEAEAITDLARQVRQNHSRGEQFDKLASELEKHAEKVTEAAARQNLPEINAELGEMAEYCAECHNAFRW